MNTINQNIRKKITLLNFILCVVILVYHSNCARAMQYEYRDFFYYLSDCLTLFGHCAVPTFFALSAFLFYRNFSIDKYGEKMKSRFKSLVLPYLIWNTIYCVLFVSFHYIPLIEQNVNTTFPFNPIENLTGILSSKFTPLWFVRNLIIYVICSPLIYYIIKNRYIGLTAVCTTAAINMFFFTFAYKSVFHWLPIYLVGAYVGHHYSAKLMTSIFRSRMIALFFLLIFTIAYTALVSFKNDLTFFIYRFLSPICIWVLLDYLIHYDRQEERDYYKYSFFIYANHFFILTALQRIIINVIPTPQIAFGINYLLIPPIVLFLLIITVRGLKKFFPKFYSVSVGGR